MSKFAPMVAALALLASTSAGADVLVMDAVQQAPSNSSVGLERPRNGQSMAQVEARFGKPAQVIQAVGDPPITRWQYGGYTVYFEYDRVLHSVVHR